MTHYPYQPDLADDEFGIAPHTNTSFLTLLAPNDVPGLSIRTLGGKWIDAPAVPGAFDVNSGELLPNIDWPIAAVPTYVGSDNPPKYSTIYYTD